jgi:hypothetical protein
VLDIKMKSLRREVIQPTEGFIHIKFREIIGLEIRAICYVTLLPCFHQVFYIEFQYL